MARFLIEVAHEAEETACKRAVQVLLNTGSHFLTNADWGCRDGDHRGWIILDAEDKNEARLALPPGVRENAKIVQLNKFTLADVADLESYHQG